MSDPAIIPHGTMPSGHARLVSFGPAPAAALRNMHPDVDPVRAKGVAGRSSALMDGHLFATPVPPAEAKTHAR